MIWRVLALAFLISQPMMGCAQHAQLRPPGEVLTDAEAVLAKVTERTARLRSLSVEARVSYYGKEGARKAKAVILARRPAGLHFSVYSPTDDMLAVLASDGERFTSFERGASTCYVGRSCAENIGRFSFFPLEGAKLVDTLVAEGRVGVIAFKGEILLQINGKTILVRNQ